jgi:hypothetical protein
VTLFRFPRLIMAGVALALCAAPVHAQQPAPQGQRIPIPNATPAHLAAARELVAATGLAASFLQVIPSLMGQINSNVTATRPELIPDMKATLEQLSPEFGKLPEDMFDRAAKIYTAVLTEQECKDALKFFQSPIGKKFVDVQPTIIGNINPLIQAWAKEISVTMFDRVRVEMKKKGHDL